MLDKAIISGKEKRKPYRGSKSIDKSCRNNGGCPYCEGNRTYKNLKKVQSAKQKEKEIYYYPCSEFSDMDNFFKIKLFFNNQPILQKIYFV